MNSGMERDDNSKDKKAIDLRVLVDQLYELNKSKSIHFFGDHDQNEPLIASSIDLSKVRLPLGYHYDADNGLTSFHGGSLRVVNCPSAIDTIRGKDRSWFQEQSSHQFYEGSIEGSQFINEIPKTAEQCEQIDRIIGLINKKRQARGLSKRLIDNRIVHIFKEETWGTPKLSAFWTPGRQQIAVCEQTNKLSLMEYVCHEIEHLARYNAISYGRDPEGRVTIQETDRVGFTTFNGKKSYFLALNEAITQEVATRILKDELANNQYYADEMAESEQLKKKYSQRKVIGMDERGNKRYQSLADADALAFYEIEEGNLILVGYTYYRERRCLRCLIYKIAKYSQQSSEVVFDMFDEATFTGNYLPVARLMHEIFGKGSFRKLGLNTATAESFEKFNKKLGLMHTIHKIKQLVNKPFGKLKKRFK
jgi:hypothetical protein